MTTELYDARYVANLLFDGYVPDAVKPLVLRHFHDQGYVWLGGELDSWAPEDEVDTKDAAEVASVDVDTIRRWVRSGRLVPSSRRDRRNFFIVRAVRSASGDDWRP